MSNPHHGVCTVMEWLSPERELVLEVNGEILTYHVDCSWLEDSDGLEITIDHVAWVEDEVAHANSWPPTIKRPAEIAEIIRANADVFKAEMVTVVP